MVNIQHDFSNVWKKIAALFLLICFSAAAEKQPNIVLILTDDQGFDDYGFRQPPLETPNMDRLMRDGVQFTRFYTAAACAPTRSALMTGRNFLKTGTAAVGFGAEAPHLDEVFLSEELRDAGYVTGMTGKWNLGLSDAELPSRRGFDEAWPVVRDDVRSYGRYEHFKPPFFHNGTYAGREEGWQVERITDKAVRFIEMNKNRPFFLYLPYASPHEPWLCKKELQQKYMDQGIGESYAMFLGMMEQLDAQVGRIFQTLEKNGLAENTIVLFFGDNGPTPSTRILKQLPDGWYTQTGESYTLNEEEWAARNPSGFRGKKATGWECAVRNRLSIYCPARFKSKEISNMALVMDIYPTLLELAGATRRAGAPKLDGISLLPLLQQNRADWPERTCFSGETGKPQPCLDADGWSYRFTKHSFPLNGRSTFFVSGDWSVVNDFGTWGLFNLADDPQQKKDLKNDMPEKFAGMKQQYDAAFKEIQADPHAWSDPVQEVGPEAYLEMECIYRFKGDNDITWANTFMKEVGAVQEMKVHVVEPGTYQIRLRALNVPADTAIRFTAGESSTDALLSPGKKYHNLGTAQVNAGDQAFALELLETGDLEAVGKMELFSLTLNKTEE
jgi:arylsulfatase A-like enzyme